MRSSTKTLAFPLAGVSRRGAHRQATPPFTCPWAVNVRTADPAELRRRGGSRPGLAKLCETDLGAAVTALIPVVYYDTTSTRRYDLVFVVDGTLGRVRAGVASTLTAELEGPDGVDILDDNSVTIDFASTVTNTALMGVVQNGKVLLADSVLNLYDPSSGIVEPVVATEGSVPTAQPVIALYRDRVFLAGGSTQAWFCSRVGDRTDWDYGEAMEDPGHAVAGQLSDAGDMGDVLTALVPIHDRALVMATASSLWVLHGDPTTGRLECVSESVGIVGRTAWAASPDGTIVFLSHDGVYVYAVGSPPVRFSAERVPEELREVSTTTYTVSMAYDPVGCGFHLFLTPADGVTVGYHWWIDLENRAFWPQRYARRHQPLAAALLTEAGLGNVVLACQDGYLRYHLDGQADDDGEDLESHVLLGPIFLGANDTQDGLLAEIHGVLEGVGDSATWRVVPGRSAAEATEAALDDLDLVLDGQAPVSVASSGTWGEGKNMRQSPRTRGPWVVVWLSSSSAWSYEAVALVTRALGRHR